MIAGAIAGVRRGAALCIIHPSSLIPHPSALIPHPPSLVVCVALLAPGTAPAMAQALTDPMRPPAALAPEVPAVEGAASPVHRLQSVIISPTRKAAIINGVLVELGGKYGDAVLTKVTEDEVVLSRDSDREVLKLYPAVETIGVTPGTGKGAPRKADPNATTRGEPSRAPDGGSRKR